MDRWEWEEEILEMVTDALSWTVGLLLLPVSLLWRTLKLCMQLACDE